MCQYLKGKPILTIFHLLLTFSSRPSSLIFHIMKEMSQADRENFRFLFAGFYCNYFTCRPNSNPCLGTQPTGLYSADTSTLVLLFRMDYELNNSLMWLPEIKFVLFDFKHLRLQRFTASGRGTFSAAHSTVFHIKKKTTSFVKLRKRSPKW